MGGRPPEGPDEGSFKTEKVPGELTPGARIIGSIATEGEPVRGEARESLLREVRGAYERADSSLREEIPAEHRDQVRGYFNGIEEQLEQGDD